MRNQYKSLLASQHTEIQEVLKKNLDHSLSSLSRVNVFHRFFTNRNDPYLSQIQQLRITGLTTKQKFGGLMTLYNDLKESIDFDHLANQWHSKIAAELNKLLSGVSALETIPYEDQAIQSYLAYTESNFYCR